MQDGDEPRILTPGCDTPIVDTGLVEIGTVVTLRLVNFTS